jgi:dihydrofolate synthase/folylpolyglutamate synthase
MDLSAWLERIQTLHPQEIELGLHRVREVAARLGLWRPAPLVVTVAGTNGKGSTVAMLASILTAAGYKVGTYTSPHILRYNERITIAQEVVTDQDLCDAFARIDTARGELSITYFEYSTLAGLLLLEEAKLDIAVLEIGLGGRLDAVNIVDPDLSIITSIGLDHQDWLGDTRELIAIEKAGILRAGVPSICGDEDPPQSLREEAQRVGTTMRFQGRDFGFVETPAYWDWWHRDARGELLHKESLPFPGLDLVNAATVLQALEYLPLSIPRAALEEGLRRPQIAGRYQLIPGCHHEFKLRVDVAHNPHAAALLAKKLRKARENGEVRGKIRVILAMMSDKDHAGFYAALESEVDIWYIAAFAEPRCLNAEKLLEILCLGGATSRGPFEDIATAYATACSEASSDDLILATGSFVTVADTLSLVAQDSTR